MGTRYVRHVYLRRTGQLLLIWFSYEESMEGLTFIPIQSDLIFNLDNAKNFVIWLRDKDTCGSYPIYCLFHGADWFPNITSITHNGFPS